MLMKPKTIVFWGREDIFSHSVKYFLSAENGWSVHNISPREKLDAVIQKINEVNPEVVVIHQENYARKINQSNILLQVRPRLKVITFSSGDAVMEVYSKQDVLVESVADLISVVKADLTKIAGYEKKTSANR